MPRGRAANITALVSGVAGYLISDIFFDSYWINLGVSAVSALFGTLIVEGCTLEYLQRQSEQRVNASNTSSRRYVSSDNTAQEGNCGANEGGEGLESKVVGNVLDASRKQEKEAAEKIRYFPSRENTHSTSQ